MLDGLSIVVPAYNEEASIAATVADALAVGEQVAHTLEVVVCDDGSHDRTGALLDELAAEEPRLRVFHRARNRGIEASMRALYASARQPWIFLMSADRQWPMSCLLTMAAEAERGAELVVGVRTDKRSTYTPYRRLISLGYEAVVRALGSPVGDPGSIKLGRAELLRAPVAARGVFAEGERVLRAARTGARVVGCPVPFSPRRAGKATGAGGRVVGRALADVARVGASLLSGWPAPQPAERDPEDQS